MDAQRERATSTGGNPRLMDADVRRAPVCPANTWIPGSHDGDGCREQLSGKNNRSACRSSARSSTCSLAKVLYVSDMVAPTRLMCDEAPGPVSVCVMIQYRPGETTSKPPTCAPVSMGRSLAVK